MMKSNKERAKRATKKKGFVKTPLTDKNVGFPMPFIMDAPKAAKIIARGIARDQCVVSFPLPMSLLAFLASVIPADLTDTIVGRFIDV